MSSASKCAWCWNADATRSVRNSSTGVKLGVCNVRRANFCISCGGLTACDPHHFSVMCVRAQVCASDIAAPRTVCSRCHTPQSLIGAKSRLLPQCRACLTQWPVGPYCETALCPRTPKAYEAVARMGPSHWLCCFECFGHAMRRARACGECGVPRAQDELTTIVRGMAVARVCESCKRLFDMDPNRSFSLAARPPVPLMSTEPALEDMVSKAFAVFLLETFACGIYLTQGRVGGSQPATLRGAGGSIAGIGKQSGTDFNAPFNTILIGSWTVLDSIDESPARLDDGAIAAADDQLLPPPMSPVLPVMPPPPPGGSRHVPMRPLSRSSRQLMSPVPPLPSALSSPQLNANNHIGEDGWKLGQSSSSSGDDAMSFNGNSLSSSSRPPLSPRTASPRDYGGGGGGGGSEKVYGQLAPEMDASPPPPSMAGREKLYGKLAPEPSGAAPMLVERARSDTEVGRSASTGGGGGIEKVYGVLAPEEPVASPFSVVRRPSNTPSPVIGGGNGGGGSPLLNNSGGMPKQQYTSLSPEQEPRELPATPSRPRTLRPTPSSPAAEPAFDVSDTNTVRKPRRAVPGLPNSAPSSPTPPSMGAAPGLPPPARRSMPRPVSLMVSSAAVSQATPLAPSSPPAGPRPVARRVSLRGPALQARPPASDDDYGTIPQQQAAAPADGPIVAENYNAIPLPPGQLGMGSGMPPYMAESWFHTNHERFAGAALLESPAYSNGTFLFVPGEQQNTLVLLYKRDNRVLARDINYVGGLFNDPLLQTSPHALFRSLGEFIRAFNSAEMLRVLSAFIGPELAGVAMPSNPADFMLEDFYHHVDGDGAVALLKRPNQQDGDYLFRASKSTTADPQLCLSYREGTAVRHQRISWNTKRQIFEQHGSTNTFPTLQALVKAVNHAATLTGRAMPLRNVVTRT